MSRIIPRRLVLFLDGTWNGNDGTSAPTNIVRMHEALKIGVDALSTEEVDEKVGNFGHGSVVKGRAGTFEYVVRYDPGVGTGVFDRFSGGIWGEGLDANIRQAYRFLSQHYRPGDEIHVFGFSRGAFTARSVVGYLAATGLLKAEHCTAEREEQTWRHYRTSPDDRHCGDWTALQAFMNPAGLIVKSVGVFDTVGALGIPGDIFQKLNRDRFAFHNTQLSAIVESSFHAVAIDEHRTSFEATLWHTPKFKRYPGALIEQVWFPGAHADIGGGEPNWQMDPPGRQDIAYDWMVRRLIDRVGLDFAEPDTPTAATLRADARAALEADIHRPWASLDRVRPQACRAINQTPPRPSDGVPLKARGIKVVGLAPYEDPIGEMIHISALALLASDGGVPWQKLPGRHVYRSPNLVAVLPLIAASYREWDAKAWSAWMRAAERLRGDRTEVPTLYVSDWTGAAIPAKPPGAVAPGDPRNVFTYLGSDPALFGL